MKKMRFEHVLKVKTQVSLYYDDDDDDDEDEDVRWDENDFDVTRLPTISTFPYFLAGSFSSLVSRSL